MSEEAGFKEPGGAEDSTIGVPITGEAPITAAAPTIESPMILAAPIIPPSEQLSEDLTTAENTDTVTTPEATMVGVNALQPDLAAVDTPVNIAAEPSLQPTDNVVEPSGVTPMEVSQLEPVEQPTFEQNLEPVIAPEVTQPLASELTATVEASLETGNTLVGKENDITTDAMEVTKEQNVTDNNTEQNNTDDTNVIEQINALNTETNVSSESEKEKNGGEKRNVSECVSDGNEERSNKKMKPSANEEDNSITSDKSSVEATTNGLATASVADPCEVSSSIKLKEGLSVSSEVLTNGSASDNIIETEEAKNDDNAQEKKSENSIEKNESESKSQNESTEEGEEEEMGDTASKLLASGISISLIKKKGGESGSGEGAGTASTEQQESTETPNTNQETENGTTNPLEVGPNISVTMINKTSTTTPATTTDTPPTSSSPAAVPASTSVSTASASATSATKFTLSLKSQSLLMDPKKSETSSNTPNIVSSGGSSSVADSISVSKISRPASANNQAALAAAKQSSLAASQNSLSRSAGAATSNGMPGLQPRPFLTRANPSGSQHLANAGPVSEQLNLVAGGIADYMRHGIEEILRELSAQGSAEATIKGLQLEMERIKWRHQQELAEVKANIDNMLKDMKAKITNESQRTIDEFKKQAEIERQKAILETKKKQWCAQCGKEAIFYCCWNTSYCDYPCQQSHWPSHMATCAQTTADEEAQQQQDQKPAIAAAQQQVQQVQQQQQHIQSPVASMMNSMHRQPGVVGGMGMNSLSMASDVTNGLTPSSMGGYMLGGMGGMNMRPSSQSMMRGNPMGMGNGMRPGVPGQLTISRPPYFM